MGVRAKVSKNLNMVMLPYALLALLADIAPARRACRAPRRSASLQDLEAPSFFGVSMPSRCARCQSVVDGMPYVADAWKQNFAVALAELCILMRQCS